MQGINTIIWDWNGTLFNDIDICIESINLLLFERGIDQIDKKRYLEVFDFPVRDYYERIGFDLKKKPLKYRLFSLSIIILRKLIRHCCILRLVKF